MNPRILVLVGVASAALAGASPASAEIRTLTTSGLWSAFGGKGDDLRAVCGIGTEGAATRRITIQQFAGETGLELRLKKDSWTIPANTSVGIAVQFDRLAPLPLQATGTDHQLVVTMTFEQSIPLMRGIRAGRQIQIVFQSGNELPWVGGLTGSARAIDAFNTCRDGLTPASATQPFAPPPPVSPPAVPPASVQGHP